MLKKIPSLVDPLNLDMAAPHSRVRYVLETYCRSTYMYNAVLLDDPETLEKTDEEICRKLFRAVLKSKEKGVTVNATRRLQALFQVVPIGLSLEKEARRCAGKMKERAEQEQTGMNAHEKKLRSLARRCLWLMGRMAAPRHLREARDRRTTEGLWRKKVEKYWNEREERGGLKNRKLPKIRWGREPQIWSAGGLKCRERRLATKWFIGKFPIPRRGERTPRHQHEMLAALLSSDKEWTGTERTKLKETIEALM